MVENSALSIDNHALHRVWDDKKARAEELVRVLLIEIPERDNSVLLTVHQSAVHQSLRRASADIAVVFRLNACNHINGLVQVLVERLVSATISSVRSLTHSANATFTSTF